VAAEAVKAFLLFCKLSGTVRPFHFYEVSRADLFAAAAFLTFFCIKMRSFYKHFGCQKIYETWNYFLQRLGISYNFKACRTAVFFRRAALQPSALSGSYFE
jgi:hypothetical protein